MDSRVLAQVRKALVDYESDLPRTAMIHWSGVDPQEAMLIAYLERILVLSERLGKCGEAREVLAIVMEDLV